VTAPKKVVPGDQICKYDESCVLGGGLHVHQGIVYSTLLGFLKTEQKGEVKEISVERVNSDVTLTALPKSNDIITCKVVSVNPRQVKVLILSVQGKRLPQHFRGIIKKEDIRAKEKDSVIVYKCYRPGDLVLARVISIGDAASYFLSTAENELGVVFAQSSEGGVSMVPVSWCEMKCPNTNTREYRKVAKVIAR